MFALDALELARIQFGFTISFHIVFPALTIGLASYLAVLEARWLLSGDAVFRDLYRYWVKVFAVAFGMGVVSGIVMAYQFGTNWSEFARFSGSVTGPLLAYEVLTAFFLEAGFLGVMLFGWNRVGPRLHFLSTVMVALGTLVSTFWILASNSWMHTPQGHAIVDGRVVPLDWLQIIFNPSFPYRFAHMVTAAFLATALVVGAAGAWHLLNRRDGPHVRIMFSMALWMVLFTAPIQAVIGDLHGLNTLKHQPAKIAAIEGHWQNLPGEPMPFIVFGWPDMTREETRFALTIPYLGSLLLTHSIDGQVPALKDFAPRDRPNATIVFWTFRVMVGLGLLMIALGLTGALLRRSGELYRKRWFLRFAVAMGPAGLIAILAGWYTTEIGRQPWLIHGVMRTADGVSAHSATQVGISLVMFVVVYLIVFGAGTLYGLRLMGRGPTAEGVEPPVQGGPGQHRHPMRPLSAATEGDAPRPGDTASEPR